MEILMRKQEVLDLLKAEIQKAGSQKALAEAVGISAPYLNDVLNEHRGFGPKLLEWLGLEPAALYRRKEEKPKRKVG